PQSGRHGVVPGVCYAEAGVIGGERSVDAVGRTIDGDGKLLDEITRGIEDVVTAHATWLLPDQVGFKEDGQAHTARSHVSDAERHPSGQGLFKREVHLVRIRRNEVGIEAVETL